MAPAMHTMQQPRRRAVGVVTRAGGVLRATPRSVRLDVASLIGVLLALPRAMSADGDGGSDYNVSGGCGGAGGSGGGNGGGPISIPRFSALSTHTFVHTLVPTGCPFVVTDATSGWKARQWTLGSLRAAHGTQVRNRHIERGEPMFGESGEFLGRYEPTDEEWGEMLQEWMSDTEDDAYIAWQVRNRTASRLLQQDYSTPYFLVPYGASSVPSVGGANPNITETLFIGLERGEAREGHVDYSCESVWSAQLQGQKRWRLRGPADSQGVLARDVAGAGGIWREEEEMETVLSPGDLLVWHPAWTHATEILESPSVSLSVQFSQPLPSRFLQQHEPSIRQHSQVHGSFNHCFEVNLAA